jgi:serine/threonine protein kinase
MSDISDSISQTGDHPANQPDSLDDLAEKRLIEAVQGYLRELEEGRHPDRRQWLARYSDIASELNECLEGLKFVQEAADSIHPSLTPSQKTDFSPWTSEPVGDFQIIKEIGRGGMGIIYEAIQLSLNRRVALKVVPFAASIDSMCLQRFHQEAQAAAQLHHNHIVPIYAVGCDRGIHYYAMQLIDGLSLDRIVHEMRRESPSASLEATISDTISLLPLQSHASCATPPEPVEKNLPSESLAAVQDSTLAQPLGQSLLNHLSADLSVQRGREKARAYRTMVRLMAQAAEALEYAHNQGIIHRDIKPANLLVDAQHNLWITDFGLAHLHRDDNLTRTGDLVGTLRYASPEQVAGQKVLLDHRTDLYSLGATFYEIITLKPVFPGTNRHALLQQVLNADPVRPYAIDHAIPTELETILLKLLDKNPAERYNSAQALADDLHRFLRDEPIYAKSPTMLERTRKWGRRHPAYVVAFIFVMFLTLIVSGVSNWLISQANTRTKAALRAERIRAEEAERRFSQARQAVDIMIEVSENDLDKPPTQPLQKRLLETALVFYQDFIAQYEDDPNRESELLSVQKRLQKVLEDLAAIEGTGQLILLGEKSVQDDLALDESKKKQIEAITQDFNRQRPTLSRDMQNLNLAERREKFLEFARTNQRVVKSILDEKQLKRLDQIRLQLQGFGAFGEPKVVSTLMLTDSQRQALRQIEGEAFMLTKDGGGLADDATRRELRGNILRSAMEKCLTILTPGQSSQWHELIGSPFEGKLSNDLPGIPPQP